MLNKCFPLIAAPFLLILGAAPEYSQNQPAPSADADHARHRVAISLLRAINTKEVTYKMKHGAYASKDAILASEEFAGKGVSWALRNDPKLANTHLSNGPDYCLDGR